MSTLQISQDKDTLLYTVTNQTINKRFKKKDSMIKFINKKILPLSNHKFVLFYVNNILLLNKCNYGKKNDEELNLSRLLEIENKYINLKKCFLRSKNLKREEEYINNFCKETYTPIDIINNIIDKLKLIFYSQGYEKTIEFIKNNDYIYLISKQEKLFYRRFINRLDFKFTRVKYC